jgi:hypothetical protein
LQRIFSGGCHGVFLFAQLVIVLILSSGCSITVAQKPDINLVKPNDAGILMIGEFTSDHPGWKSLEPSFRRKVVKCLLDEKVFDNVIGVSRHKSGALLLAGNIKEIDEGSSVARTLISFGAGKATIKGQFELRDYSKKTLLRFESHGSEYGGGGLLFGVAGLVGGMGGQERLIAGLAASVAHTIERWTKGDDLD